jgi:hypothetical protein
MKLKSSYGFLTFLILVIQEWHIRLGFEKYPTRKSAGTGYPCVPRALQEISGITPKQETTDSSHILPSWIWEILMIPNVTLDQKTSCPEVYRVSSKSSRKMLG